MADKSVINPSSLSIYFGVPGCGKSTIAAALIQRVSKSVGAHRVFCNYSVSNSTLFDTADLGRYDFGSEGSSYVVIDEAGLAYNNRDFKSFSKANLEFFKLHRHFRCEVVVFSQTYNDMDLKIRGCCTQLYLVRRFGLFFVRAIPVYKKIGINELTKEITDEYYTGNFFRMLFGSHYYFMPRYWKYFDSYTKPDLPPYPNNKLKK